MNTKVRVLAPCKREIEIEVPKEAVAGKFVEVFSEIAKHSNIKGFRPGKAPQKIVEQYYSKLAEEEVIKALIPEYYKKAIEKEKLAPAVYPDISDVKLNEGKLVFKVAFDIRPEVKLKDYKGIKVKPPKVEVKESDISEALEAMRKNYVRSLQKDKTQEEKLPLPQLDDELAKKIGYKDLADLKSRINSELLNASKNRALSDQRRQVVEHLLVGSNFDVPESWVKRQFAHLVNNTKINLLLSGVKKEELDSKIKEKESEIEKQAQDNVRLFFILEKIADKEEVKVSEVELKEYLKALALRQGVSEEEMIKYLDEKGLWDDLVSEIRQEKVMDFLIKEAEKS